MKKITLLFLCIICIFSSCQQHEHDYISQQYIPDSECFGVTYIIERPNNSNKIELPLYKTDSCRICHKVNTIYEPYDLNYCPASVYNEHDFYTENYLSNYSIQKCSLCKLTRRNFYDARDYDLKYEYQNPFNMNGQYIGIKIKITSTN